MSQTVQSGLLLLGVGGGGCRLAASVLAAYGDGMRALGVDTDALSNRQAAVGGLNCLLFGGARLAGHGTGGDAIKGRLVVQDDMQNIVPHLEGVRTVVLTACLGAGTGGGATPEIVKALHDMGIATFCFVTMPFGFEGDARRKAAERVLPMIEENADSMVIISLDELYTEMESAPLEDAILKAESCIAAGISLMWRLVTKPGFIQSDSERLHAMVLRGGTARFGYASATGKNRAALASEGLRNCRLLRAGDAFSKANALLLGILAGPDLRLAEIGEITGNVRLLCKVECGIEMGTVLDAQYEGRIELVVVTFENWAVATVQAESRKEKSPLSEPPVAEDFPIQSGSKRTRGKGSKLSFGATGRGKFQNVEPTIFEGQDLDIPTFVRRNIQLDR